MDRLDYYFAAFATGLANRIDTESDDSLIETCFRLARKAVVRRDRVDAAELRSKREALDRAQHPTRYCHGGSVDLATGRADLPDAECSLPVAEVIDGHGYCEGHAKLEHEAIAADEPSPAPADGSCAPPRADAVGVGEIDTELERPERASALEPGFDLMAELKRALESAGTGATPQGPAAPSEASRGGIAPAAPEDGAPLRTEVAGHAAEEVASAAPSSHPPPATEGSNGPAAMEADHLGSAAANETEVAPSAGLAPESPKSMESEAPSPVVAASRSGRRQRRSGGVARTAAGLTCGGTRCHETAGTEHHDPTDPTCRKFRKPDVVTPPGEGKRQARAIREQLEGPEVSR